MHGKNQKINNEIMNLQFYHCCGKVPANFSLSFFLLSHRMPQGRRKTPFSGKAKKEQLQQKRNRGHNNGAFLLYIVWLEIEQVEMAL